MATPGQALAITRADWEELRDRLLTLEIGQAGIQKSLLAHYDQETKRLTKIDKDSLALDDRVTKIEDTEKARRNWAIGAMAAVGLLWPMAWEKLKLIFK